MKWMKSYTVRIFLLLGIIVMCTTIVNNYIFIRVSETTLREETVQIYQNMVTHDADDLAGAIDDIIRVGNEIRNDVQVINACVEDNVSTQTSYAVDNFLREHLWSDSTYGIQNFFIYGLDGLRYTTDTGATIQSINGDVTYSTFRDDVYISNIIYHPDNEGIYRYTFQTVQAIQDHLSNEIVGYLVMDISEHALFRNFKLSHGLATEGLVLYIVDGENTIISSANKDQIGTTFQSSEQDDVLSSLILGTPWELVLNLPTTVVSSPFVTMQGIVLWVLVISLLLLAFIIWFFMNRFFRRMKTLSYGIKRVAAGDMVELKVHSEFDFGEIFETFNSMSKKVNEQMQLIADKEQQKRLLEIDFLRAQINPHFVYNTLSSIRFYVEMNRNEEANEMLVSFAKLLRKTLTPSGAYIRIEQELDSVREYIQLQTYRYPDTFLVSYAIESEVLQCKILAFIIQPLIENAIFHAPQSGKCCHIRISMYEKDDYIRVEVCDDGRGMDKEQLDHIFDTPSGINKIALKNINERLRLNYGAIGKLEVSSEKGKGSTFAFSIPKEKEGLPC